MDGKPRVGISSCLLGQKVRFDGGHKLDRYLRDELGAFVDFVPVCPEVELGLPVPREALRLVGDPDAPRLRGSKGGEDLTGAMKAWAAQRLDGLEDEGLSGFVFKSGSPSSGMERVRVYRENGIPSKDGSGIFARAFMDRFPLIPVEDDGRLQDAGLRENFIERIFALGRWRALRAERPSLGRLVEFHAAHKLMLMAHSPRHYSALGRLVAGGKGRSLRGLYDEYEGSFVEALALLATPRKNANALSHIAGYFKKELTAAERQELVGIIDSYRGGLLPLIVPVTLLNHYATKYDVEYLKAQHYLRPHPLELRLRNHV